MWSQLADTDALKADLASRDSSKTRDRIKYGGLTCAIGADQRSNLAWWRSNAEAGHGFHATVANGHIRESELSGSHLHNIVLITALMKAIGRDEKRTAASAVPGPGVQH